MIFLSVGTQAPFDRLVRAVDAWAASHAQPVFGQLGALTANSYRPRHFEWRDFIAADEYQRRLREARILVAHVGMGSIISALSNGKPLVMLARQAALGEHRNEHQLATAARFRDRAGLYFADADSDVGPLIDRVLAMDSNDAATTLPPFAEPQLIAAVRDFLRHKP